jgi:hypothetical protein
MEFDMKKILLPMMLIAFWSCEEEPLPEDCAGVEGGDNICGCTDSTATNYDNTATFDDGSCEVDPCPDLTTAFTDATNAFVDSMDLTAGTFGATECAAMVAAYKAGLDAGCDGYTQADYDVLVAMCNS